MSSKLSALRFFALLLLSCCACCIASPQAVNSGNQTGLPVFQSFSGSQFDSISMSNGSLHIDIPLVSIPGRKGDQQYHFIYNTPAWTAKSTVGGAGGSGNAAAVIPAIDPSTGWNLTSELGWTVTWVQDAAQCGTQNQPISNNYFHEFAAIGPDGTKHPLAIQWEAGTPCPGFGSIPTGYTLDGTGVFVDITSWSSGAPNIAQTKITLKDGSQVTINSRRDSNGNLLTPSADTLNRAILSVANGPNTTYTSPLGQTMTAPAYQQYNVTDSGGTLRIFRLDSQLIDVQTNDCGFLGNPGTCQEDTQPRLVPRKLTLPDGLVYVFTYDNASYADLTRIDLPTGGSIAYTYAQGNCCGVVTTNSQLAQVSTYSLNSIITSRTVTNTDGATATWNYNILLGTVAQNSVIDPFGTKEVHSFAFLAGAPINGGNSVPYETDVQTFNSAGTLLRSVHKDYAFNTGNTDTSPLSVPEVQNARVIRETTTLDNGFVTKNETDYETISPGSGRTVTFLNPTEVREYDYGSGAPGPLLRRTDYTYLHQSNSTYLNLNILGLTTSVIVYDGSGNTMAQAQYEYDNYTAGIQASGAIQHDSAFGTSYLSRGNVTAVKRWRNTDGAYLTTRNQYDDAGNLVQTTDPNGNTTTFDYTDSWSNTACAPSGASKAYVTKTTNALNQATASAYNSCSGTLASAAYPNNLVTTHSYEMMNRRIQSNFPDAGQATACFSDVIGSTCYSASLPLTVTQTQKINSSLTKTLKTVSDGLGRPVQTQLTSDPQGTVLTDTAYDALGRVHSVSNPYRTGSDPTSSPGTTTYGYDALGRKTSETYPDNSVLTTAYCGSSTLVTDPTGKQRRSRTDALGRLVEVDEPNAVGVTLASTGCPGTGEPLWVTSYSYDTLGNLTSVLQNGSHQRTFTYDSLSHMLASTNPEVGTITYAYDADGNLSTKTDARGITTTYAYDALNRETSRTFSNGDPSVTTTYDQSNCLGLASCSNIGHRTSMTDAVGSEAWAYQIDPANLRSIHVDQRTNNTKFGLGGPVKVTKTSTYYLNLAGNITQAVYPTGRVVNYTFDAADRPSTATDGSNGITYATGFQAPPSGTNCLSTAVCYTPQGTFYALSIGQSSTFTGLNLKHTYNSRLQPNEFSALSSAGNAIDISYNFVDPVTTHNAGHVYGIINNLDTTRSQVFTYDQLNRITSALTTSTQATSPTHCWGETYSIDPWANLQSIAATTNPNYTGCSQESGFAQTADGNNHLSGFSYDLSGNTQNDGANTYTWDAESQLKSGGGLNYLYDGDGRRVSKTDPRFHGNITVYWYGAAGEILAETDYKGLTARNEYIFFGGQRIAVLPAAANPNYYVEDLLGTSRVMTTNTGAVCYDADFYPFGGERTPYTNTCPQNYKFEGKERDTETGNDDFGARYYSNRFGRWLSADWSAVPVAVPYANLTNPQTLNLYAMVADDPESFADLDGHCCWDEVKGAAIGIWNVASGVAVSTYETAKAYANALDKGGEPGLAVAAISNAVDTLESAKDSVTTAADAYSSKGASGVANQVLDQGEQGAMQMVTEAVVTGGVGASVMVDGVTPQRWGAPDSNIVVRGGQSPMPPAGTKFSGSQGATLEDAAQGVPHGNIRQSTAGDIRKAGGSVRSKPELTKGGKMNPKHVNIREGTKKPSTFSKPKPNPVPKKDRVQ
jgi:RHS repeat-associated protein